MKPLLCTFGFFASAFSLTFASDGEVFDRDSIEPFLSENCYECHDDLTSEGDLNLLDLNFVPDNARNQSQWIKIFDRVKSGEMPPEKQPRPEEKKKSSFLSTVETPLTDVQKKVTNELGRGRIRRLNRSEFETSLSDIFSIPLRVQQELPEDAKTQGFATAGKALNISSVQMEAYLNVLDSVFDEATTLYPRPERRTHRLTYLEENGIMQVYRKGGPYHIQKDGVAFFGTEKFSHLNAVLSQYTTPHKAKYKIKVSAYALRSKEPVILSLRAGGTGHAESNHVPHVFLKHMPVAEGEPQVFEWEGWIERGSYLHVYPTSLRPMRFAGKNEQGLQSSYEGPAAVVQWVEVDGPIFEEWPPPSHKALWGNLSAKPIRGATENANPIAHLDEPPSKVAQPRLTLAPKNKETGNRYIYDPKQGVGGEPIHRAAQIPEPLHSTRELVTKSPKQDATRLLTEMASKAYRRPVERAEIAPYIALTHKWLYEGVEFEKAMRVGYKAIFTSPGFLYHQGTLPNAQSELDSYALAERLSFFLWNGLPDKDLLKAAEGNQLKDPEVLRTQVDRMLDHKNSDRFLKDFTDQWLDLRLIDFTVPDDKLYPEFDKLLEWSMVEETRKFVERMIEEDLSTDHLIDSDFVMANWRLAKHYGLPAMRTMEVEPVSLPENSVRGGLITQASLLKVTANGTTTSPVVRGVWMLEKLIGDHPSPPPPGIPAIEPDIRGAVSIRDQLEQHRNSESCAGCHRIIDPPGMALESFDVIGNWRENYRALNDELLDLKPRYSPFKEVPIRYLDGPAVDASAIMADGTAFEDITEFKKLLLKDSRKIARGMVEKLILYSTGAEITFADRIEVEAILDRAENKDFGLRSLIHEVTQSHLFSIK